MKFKDFFKKENIVPFIKNTLIVMLGTFILALGTETCIIPSGLDIGGVSGIAICFVYANINIEPELVITILCWILFFLGLIFLGWSFSTQTIVSTITYPIFLYLINYLLNKFSFLSIIDSPSLESNMPMTLLICSILGGILVGAGCAVAFIGGGSTGGVDIITFIICKYIPRIKSSHMIFVIDALIILAGFIVNPIHDVVLAFLGILSAFIGAVVIDKVFIGSTQSFIAQIITDKHIEITDDVIKELERTTTIVDVEGGYTKKNQKMVMVSFTIREYSKIINIVAKNDKKAFMTIGRAHEINGEGFKPIK